tara:strand:- start:2251 stop:2802 length:552 start_codon:yes stop_codon:yes gene_type:complete
MFCGKCGNQNPDENKFCSGCGSPLGQAGTNGEQSNTPSVQEAPPQEKEKVYYRGEGELLIRTTKHHGAGRKAASFIAGAGVGYLIAGRDSKRTTKAKGSLIITNKSIICAGNKITFDNIVAVTIKGTLQKKIHLTLDQNAGVAGGGKGAGGGNRISVEVEIKSDDLDGVFKGLENARMENVDL